MLNRSLLLLQRLVLRTQGGRLRPLWALCYGLAVRALAAAVRRGEPAAAVYVEGSLAERGAVYGLSDIDFSIVAPAEPGAPGAARARLREKAAAVQRRLPGRLDELLYCRAFEQEDLERPEPVFLHGLDHDGRDSSRALYLGSPSLRDRVSFAERPGLYGPMSNWRLVAGPERRPAAKDWGADRRRMAAWLELQIWWRRAVLLSRAPEAVGAPYLAVKLVAEPARIWLWLNDGERCDSRSDALRRARARLPAEEAFAEALDLHRNLGRRPSADVPRTLAALARLSALIAARIEADLEPLGTTDVALSGAADDLILAQGGWTGPVPASAPSPLADWRALVWPRFPDESFVTLSGSPADAAMLAACADIERGPFPTLPTDRLLVRPAQAHTHRARLRTVACRISDPVSFALREGADTARFPRARGWSAGDWARRAVAEHAAWLAVSPTPLEASGEGLGMLVSALRAALFLDSVIADEPRLPLTVTASLGALAASTGTARSAAESAVEAYAGFAERGRSPAQDTVRELERVVRRLPAYSAQSE